MFAGVAPTPASPACAEAGVPSPVTASVPVRLPCPVGANVTVTVQEPPFAASVPAGLQVPALTAKSPPAVIADRCTGLPPPFVTVVDSEALLPVATVPKPRDEGEIESIPGVVPVPLSVTTAAPEEPSSGTASCPGWEPEAAGWNAIDTVHAALAFKVAPHVVPVWT